tara:strand:- start:10757 stop:11617 length:861 start_codon:yes stop_codon:yes gene_type:complete
VDTFNNFHFSKSEVYVIAEIGINHNGDLKIAKELIKESKNAGADAVKFQKRTIDVVYSKDILDSPRESPWGKTQRDQKNGLEFGASEYDEIDLYCKKLEIDWFASAWDIESQTFLSKYNLKYNKIASAMATNLEFVEVVALENKPTFISTGMCTMEEIEKVVNIFNEKNCPFILMHTNSEYPSNEENLNLKMIQTLKEDFHVNVGYSGHESSVSPSVYAVAFGAVAIERHITLDRAMYGSDQSASLEPVGFSRLVSMIRKLNLIYGDGIKKITDEEIKISEKLRYW